MPLDRAAALASLLFVLGVVPPLAAQEPEGPRPAHPAVRYSCMSDPPPGVGWPWVAAGVPYAIEVMHPGYGIQHWGGFSTPGVTYFLIEGAPRAPTVTERYASVEGVGDDGSVLIGRSLFLRSLEGVSSAYGMAERAMAILMYRADERPLTAATPDLSDLVRSRIAAPAVVGRTLTFWIRNRADMPYASQITVDLDTAVHHGDPS